MRNITANINSFALTDYNYVLPGNLIAQFPANRRDQSRLMVLDRANQSLEHKVFSDIIDYLTPGDLLVFNDTKVIPARLLGKKNGTGANIEVLLLRDLGGQIWECLVKPGKRLRQGTKIIFDKNKLNGEVLTETEFGGRNIKFNYNGDFIDLLQEIGLIPLPPYLTQHKEINAGHKLAERYQTVYARDPGSAAAPTAGLHFTPELLKKIEAKGVKKAFVTLHTGLGTFQPITAADISQHKMHEEFFRISPETRAILAETRKNGGRIIAVGTTSLRVLETALTGKAEGFTDIYIYPGYKFKSIDGLITNFHLPKSSLLVLVSALAGREFIMGAYREAIKQSYRFFSFGDAMFIS